jgi:hypothetical protein
MAVLDVIQEAETELDVVVHYHRDYSTGLEIGPANASRRSSSTETHAPSQQTVFGTDGALAESPNTPVV